jgi:methyl-accepting chemotaxis protein
MMENIEAASSEHASGISQVNVAITDMDKLTQENSLMVEQNALASQNMAMETERLRRLFSSSQDGQENVSSGFSSEQLISRSTRGIPATTQHDYNSADEPRVPLIEIPERRRNLDNFE